MGKTKKDSKKVEPRPDNSQRLAQYTDVVVSRFMFDFQELNVDDCATFGADVCLRLATLVKDFYKGNDDLEKMQNAITHIETLIEGALNRPKPATPESAAPEPAPEAE